MRRAVYCQHQRGRGGKRDVVCRCADALRCLRANMVATAAGKGSDEISIDKVEK